MKQNKCEDLMKIFIQIIIEMYLCMNQVISCFVCLYYQAILVLFNLLLSFLCI